MRAARPARLPLVPHPASTPEPPARILARAEVVPGGLVLVYTLIGDTGALRIPRGGAGRRREGLWRTTCFEAFLMGEDRPAYSELNFSPAGDWAAWRFGRYRQDRKDLHPCRPAVRCRIGRGGLVLRAHLASENLPPGERLDVGLSAVLETVEGRRSCWALRHPRGAPDFHHRDGLVLGLAGPGRRPGCEAEATAWLP